MPSSIAIIGIGCMFPKAEGLEEYWSNIKHSIDAIEEIPDTHWKPEDYFDDDPKAPDMTYARRGGFLTPIEFSPLEFGITPNAIEATDTTQLFGMVVAKRALEDAGYWPADDEIRRNVSVLLGVTGTLELVIPLGARLGHPRWRQALKDAGVEDAVAKDVIERIADSYVPWQENSFPGLLGNVAAGRIANKLDLGGTNTVVDAACASSLSAIHLACMELVTGKSDMVVSGGLDTFNDIFMYMCFSKTPALSPTGNARPFDKKADGTILGEGIGIVILKRLEDAERDNDRIYAVIKGVGSSSDGSGNAIYAPCADGQGKALRDAFKIAGVSPDTIELIEGHGTGTKVGDITEVNGLTKVFRESRPDGRWCALGTVKSQIGHTKAAAGAAGLIKAALALHHKVLPPTAKVDEPLEVLAPETSPFYVNTEMRPWMPRQAHPRRAGVSSFGFGGSNFHVVLEEYESRKAEIDWDGTAIILPFAAASREALNDDLEDLPDDLTWDEIRVRALDLREVFDSQSVCRLVIVLEKDGFDLPDTKSKAAQLLSSATSHQPSIISHSAGIYFGEGEPGKLAVVFPGQGSQTTGMLRDLACHFPVFHQTLVVADSASPSRLTDLIYPHPAFNKETKAQQESLLRQTQNAQPAIGAVSMGAFKILEAFGLHPDAAAGHSFGELSAFCAAGRIDIETLNSLARLRGELMASGEGDRGSMLAVKATLDEINEAIDEESLDLIIANKNAPTQAVLSGTTSEIERAEQAFKNRKLPCKKLPVSAAFHSPLVAAARQPFADALSEVDFCDARFPVYSNTTAEEYPADGCEAQAILASQLACPVEFVRQIENMYAAGIRTFIEAGPGRILTGLIGDILKERVHAAIAMDASGGKRSGLLDLAFALAQLAAAGRGVALERWDTSAEKLRAKVESKKPAMTVKLCGANYVSPREKRPPTVRNQASDDRRSKPSEAVQPHVKAEKVESSKSMKESSLGQNFHQGEPRQPEPAPTAPSAQTQTWSTGSSRVIADNSALAQALQAAQQNIAALQQLQQQTAGLHQQFLEGQATTQQMFLKLIEQQGNLMGHVSGAGPGTGMGISEFGVSPQAAPSTPELHHSGISQPLHSEASAEPAAHTPASAPPRPSPEPRGRAVSPKADESRISKSEFQIPKSATNGNGHYEKGLLNIVAEKTGYPAEMLNLDMEMDADLGIDSIKRVEILSAFQEAFPDVPEIKSEHLGEFRTLRDVIDFLHRFGETEEATPEAEAEISHYIEEVTEALLEVVAEKTGYPVEMLELDMELDSDLGIDSIKRVEILSALEERLPGLPEIRSEHLGAFESLRHVIEFVAESRSDVHIAVPRRVATRPQEEKPRRGATRPLSDEVSSKLLEIVAEKTGYPTEMLELDMEIDSDLGIDSIKRVEIMSALEQSMPGLPEVQSEHLGAFQTLRDVVEFVAAGDAVSAGESEASESGTPVRGDLSQQIESALIQVVADKTGYPAEMLELDMEIDTDLGIDSIKRVEILSALEEQVDGLPEIQSEQLGAFNTLRDVVNFLLPAGGGEIGQPLSSAGKSGADVAAHGALRSVDRRETKAGLQRFVVKAEPLNEPREKVELPAGARILVAGEGAFADQVCTVLCERSINAVLTSLTDAISTKEPLHGLLILSPTLPPSHSHTFVIDAFKLMQQSGPALRESGGILAAVTRLDGAFGFGAQEIRFPVSGGLAGLIKTAGHEWPEVSCKVLDADPDATAERIVDELLFAGPTEVGLTGQGQGAETRRIVLEQVAADDGEEFPFAAGDVIVITGGARGVTAEVALALAETAQPSLVLLGRSPVPSDEPDWLAGLTADAEIKKAILAQSNGDALPKWVGEEYRRHMANREILKNLERIRAAGSKAHYLSVDVRSAESVKAAFADIQAGIGNVTGVIHGAGVLADRLIEDKTSAQFEMVYETKVAGLQNLLAALDGGSKLKALITFASSTARFGRKGQVDYSAANEVLNKLVQHHARQNPHCHALSLNWGPWEGGMVTPALREVFASEGVGLIPLEAGARLLVDELRRKSGHPVELVVLGPGSTVVETPCPCSGEEPAAVVAENENLSVAFERSVSVEDHPFLASHVMNGKAVLPMAIIMEWLAHGAIHENPGLTFHGFNNIRVLKGLVLEEGESADLRFLAAKAHKEDGLFIVPVEMQSESNGRLIRHASGEVVLVKSLPAGSPPAAEPATKAFNGSDVYASHLFHGADFHAIQEIEGCSKEGIIATVVCTPSPSQWIQQPLRGTWLADPLAVDSVFQLMIVWSIEQTGSPSLPSFTGSYRQFVRSFPREGVRLVATVTKSTAHQATADIDFMDGSGNLVARMEGYECTINGALREAFAANELSQPVG
ncbi:MAG: SDR family NAD(P)-dependent oxidoreductase [Planctomycetota bacterium]|nr:SDR family NAD(P)-dependent oxidoreductase [Planctomycetota bacterium]